MTVHQREAGTRRLDSERAMPECLFQVTMAVLIDFSAGRHEYFPIEFRIVQTTRMKLLVMIVLRLVEQLPQRPWGSRVFRSRRSRTQLTTFQHLSRLTLMPRRQQRHGRPARYDLEAIMDSRRRPENTASPNLLIGSRRRARFG